MTASPTALSTLHQWDLNEPRTLRILRQKWGTVPAGGPKRVRTADLLQLDDDALRRFWLERRVAATEGDEFSGRGWYHLLYRDVLRGRRVLDVGAGLGIDALSFAAHGADMTLLDIVADNLVLLERLARLLDVRIDTFHLDGIDSLGRLNGPFDVIWCQGSLIHAPCEAVRAERAALLAHVPVGGRWIEQCYPRQRWEREGRLPFDRWGERTDGAGTPWAEWYDLDKLLDAMAPARFDVVLAFNFRNDEFSWFDLVRTG